MPLVGEATADSWWAPRDERDVVVTHLDRAPFHVLAWRRPRRGELRAERTDHPRHGPRDAGLPPAADRATYEAEIERLRVREKAHTREADAIAAARRRLPMVEVDGGLELLGPDGPSTLLDAFQGRRQLLAYYFMWWPGRPAEDQCEGCTFYTNQVAELASCTRVTSPSRSSSRVATRRSAGTRRSPTTRAAVPGVHGLDHALVLSPAVARGAPPRPRTWTVPSGVLRPRRRPRLRDVLDNAARRAGDGLWLRADGPDRLGPPGVVEESPDGWPQDCTNVRTDAGAPAWTPTAEWTGRPIGQWPRLDAGYDDDLAIGDPRPSG